MSYSSLAQRVTARLAIIRERRGYSQNKVNALAGFSQGYITRLKSSGRKGLGVDGLERLAAALEVRFEWLSRGTGPVELEADPPSWEKVPPPGRVALRVVTGRGGDPDEALARLRRASLPEDAATLDYLRVISRQEEPRVARIELSPVVAQALGMLTVQDPSKARRYAAVAREIGAGSRESDPRRVAAQIESLASAPRKDQ